MVEIIIAAIGSGKAEVEARLVFGSILPSSLQKESFAGEISEEMKRREFGKEGLETLFFYAPGKKILFISLGEKEDFSAETIRKAACIAVKSAKQVKAKSLSIVPEEEQAKKEGYAICESILLSDYEFTFKSNGGKIPLEKVFVDAKISEAELARAKIVCNAVNYARDLVNNPAEKITPEYLAGEAKKLAKELGIKATIFGKKELEKEGMNAILAVGRGSTNEPCFAAMEYIHPKAKKKIAFIGKGICFDSGGLQIKPAASMDTMKSDMAGAAVSLALMKTIAQLKLPINLVCAFAAAENMLGGSAYKPGDIIKSHNGKTIEIKHTDAEGRLLLADSLSYVEKKYSPDLMIDAATLTGACFTCLGAEAAAILGTAEKEIERLTIIGENLHERVWKLPFYKEYFEEIKTDVADVANTAKPTSGAGTITAAAFLKNFVEKTPWIHLDIAGVAYLSEAKYYAPKYATGFGVRLLTAFLEENL